MEYIIFVGIIQALVAAGLMLRSKLKSTADSLLIALAICIASHLSIKFFIFSFIEDKAIRLSMNTFINYCYGPLIYLYALKLTRSDFLLIKRWYIFLPAALGVIAYFSVASILIVAPAEGYSVLRWYNRLTIFTILPSEILFSFLAIKMVLKKLAPVNRERQLVILIAGCFLALSSLALISLFVSVNEEFNNVLFRGVGYGMMTFICIRIIRYRYIAYKTNDDESNAQLEHVQHLVEEYYLPVSSKTAGIEHSGDDVNSDLETEHNSVSVLPQRQGPRPNGVNEEYMSAIMHTLDDLMITKRLYTDSTLSLDKLSLETKLNKHHISESLNQYAGKSFYHYINEYRVEDVVEKMKRFSKSKLPINMLTIAYDAGFNSKSSFNRHFKELKGVTPTEFYRVLEQDLEIDMLSV